MTAESTLSYAALGRSNSPVRKKCAVRRQIRIRRFLPRIIGTKTNGSLTAGEHHTRAVCIFPTIDRPGGNWGNGVARRWGNNVGGFSVSSISPIQRFVFTENRYDVCGARVPPIRFQHIYTYLVGRTVSFYTAVTIII